MKAAVLHEHGGSPAWGDFEEPHPSSGQVVVDVQFAGLNHLDLLKSSGKFYSGKPPIPSVVGSDGVGFLSDGRRIFFDAVMSPYGSMAERALVSEEVMVEVADGVDSAVAAALGNSGVGAWLALDWLGRLSPGETVLVLGATGSVGGVAVQIAKELGASRVIAAARPSARLAKVEADVVVELKDDNDLEAAFRAAAPQGVDVIVDPLWGPAAVAAMGVARQGARHVQMGHMASMTATIPASIVRSAGLTIMGLSGFRAPVDVRRAAYLRVSELVAQGRVAVEPEVLQLKEIEVAWDKQRKGPKSKLVIDCVDHEST